MRNLNFFMRNYRTLLMAAIGAFCLVPAYAQRPAAKLVEFAGRISVDRDGGEKALFKDNQVFAGEVVFTGPDSYARFELPDHSTFESFENARVVFKSNWPSWTELINVILGRVKIYIDHSKGPNNNNVTTPTAVISVRGTYFDVIVEDSDGTTSVSVDEGWVHVQARTAPGEVDLHAGDTYRIFRNQQIGANRGGGINQGILQKALKAAQDAAYQVLLNRAPGSPAPVGGGTIGSAGGAQGDKGKQTGSATGAPAPPAPPGGGH